MLILAYLCDSVFVTCLLVCLSVYVFASTNSSLNWNSTPLVGKTWRMSEMLNNKRLKKIRISNAQLMVFIGVWNLFICVYLAIWYSQSAPKLAITEIQVISFLCASGCCLVLLV